MDPRNKKLNASGHFFEPSWIATIKLLLRRTLVRYNSIEQYQLTQLIIIHHHLLAQDVPTERKCSINCFLPTKRPYGTWKTGWNS